MTTLAESQPRTGPVHRAAELLLDAETYAALLAGELTMPQRAFAGATLADSIDRHTAARLLDVSCSAVDRARRVRSHGTAAMVELATAGKVGLARAARVVLALTPDEQDEAARRVNAGAISRTLTPVRSAAPLQAAQGQPRRRARPTRDSSVIGADALVRLAEELHGVELAMRTVRSIEPTATAEDCAGWERAVTQGIRALSRLRKIIRTHEGERTQHDE